MKAVEGRWKAKEGRWVLAWTARERSPGVRSRRGGIVPEKRWLEVRRKLIIVG